MFNVTSDNRANALANNYIYINEDKISRTLICSICLGPLIDPQTHVLCENSFCNLCIRKLRHCPYCRTSIMELNDLNTTSPVLRNILDELQVQCNICKHILCRGDFDIHIRNNCLQLTSEGEHTSNPNEPYIEKHLSNMYNRVYKLENELYELQKVLFIFLFVLSIIGTLLFVGTFFSYITHSFISTAYTICLSSFIETLSKILFDFSPKMILIVIIFYYKNPPSDVNVSTVINYFIIAMLILYSLITYF